MQEFELKFGHRVMKHAANSGAVLTEPASYFDLVRPGALLYGYNPVGKMKSSLDLKPVMTLSSTVMFIKTVPRGTSISYGSTWKAKRKTRIATVSIGYADGYMRLLSNKAKVRIGKKLFNQVGSITMDQLMIDLGADMSVNVGDRVEMFGDFEITADTLAKKMGTVSYELLCSVSPRVRRVYHG